MSIDDSAFSRSKINIQDVLTLEEYDRITNSFVSVFDSLFDSYITEGDQAELIAFLAEFITSYKTFGIVNKGVMDTINNQVFSKVLLREFVLELLERFSLEIVAVGKSSFHRLINLLSEGSSVCKASGRTKSGSDIQYILTSLETDTETARTAYLGNPWLVVLTLLLLNFRKMQIAVNLAKKLR